MYKYSVHFSKTFFHPLEIPTKDKKKGSYKNNNYK